MEKRRSGQRLKKSLIKGTATMLLVNEPRQSQILLETAYKNAVARKKNALARKIMAMAKKNLRNATEAERLIASELYHKAMRK